MIDMAQMTLCKFPIVFHYVVFLCGECQAMPTAIQSNQSFRTSRRNFNVTWSCKDPTMSCTSCFSSSRYQVEFCLLFIIKSYSHEVQNFACYLTFNTRGLAAAVCSFLLPCVTFSDRTKKNENVE